MPTKEEDIDLLFEKGTKQSLWSIIIKYGFCIIVVLSFIWGIIIVFSIHIEIQGQLVNLAGFILSLAGGFVCNIFATKLLEKMKVSRMESKSAQKMELIKKLAKEDLLIDILKQVNYYDNKYCEDYNITARLKKKTQYEKMFTCELKYRYKKKYNSRNLIFQFVRIRNEKERAQENDRDISNSYLNNEFYYVSDERDFFDHDTELDEDCYASSYKLTHLEIMDANNETVLLKYNKISIEGSENICRYEAKIPANFPIEDNLLTMHYTLEYIIEKDSYTYFSFELPTKGIRVEFDFEDVDDEIDIFVLDFLNSHIGPHPLHKPEDKKIILTKKEWILPKSSILFNWYKKREE